MRPDYVHEEGVGRERKLEDLKAEICSIALNQPLGRGDEQITLAAVAKPVRNIGELATTRRDTPFRARHSSMVPTKSPAKDTMT